MNKMSLNLLPTPESHKQEKPPAYPALSQQVIAVGEDVHDR